MTQLICRKCKKPQTAIEPLGSKDKDCRKDGCNGTMELADQDKETNKARAEYKKLTGEAKQRADWFMGRLKKEAKK